MKPKLKTISALLGLSICVQPIQAKAEEKEMFHTKPKHVIFLIHGIGGDKTHFGHMMRALPKILNEKDPYAKYVAKSIEYDTGNNDKTPYDFARDINTVIQRTTASAKFKPEDKISLIMHSQGGLIGSIWMFQSLMGTPGFASAKTIGHIDSFITLGTPYWGAKTAKWGSEMKQLTQKLKMEVPLPYGKKELEQMTFGSDMIFDFRMALIDPQFKHHIEELNDSIRFLNVVGVADLLNPLGIFVSGTDKYEDDGAVPLASARFNFLFTQSLKKEYTEEDRSLMNAVKEVDIAPYVVVNAMHRSPLPELENFAGIAQIPRRCIKNKNCAHPTFPYLWRHILGKEVQQLDEALGNFRTFLLDINVRVDSEDVFSCEDLTIKLTKLDGTPLKGSNIEVNKFYEFYQQGNNLSTKHTNHCRFYYMGSLKAVLSHRTEGILIKVSGKDLKTRFVEMELRETYSSFVDINMEHK